MDLIRTRRQELGISQEHLGRLLGYKKGSGRVCVCSWEKGREQVPRNKLMKLSELLDIPVEELLKGAHP